MLHKTPFKKSFEQLEVFFKMKTVLPGICAASGKYG
jgi:hypothetical protein